MSLSRRRWPGFLRSFATRSANAPISTTRPKHEEWVLSSKDRNLIARIGESLGVKQFSDWYQVTRRDVEAAGGQTLFSGYRSLPQVLLNTYPDSPWDILAFCDRGPWRDKSLLIKALDQAEQRLGVVRAEDWYALPLTHLIEVGFPRISRTKLVELLEEKYPLQQWDKTFLLRKYAQQKLLEKAVRSLFPEAYIELNVRKEASLINPLTGEYLELDIFIPALNLAFEYQEHHHYLSAGYSYVPTSDIQQRDKTKRELAKEKGITLITVPFWWDRTAESLAATIKKERADALPQWDDLPANVNPIPEEIPEEIGQLYTAQIEDIGEPTTACFFTLSNINPAKWWMFEKYDGVRGFWNPLKKAFYSRKGNRFTIPQRIVDSMPSDIFLDGELWFGHDNFQEAMKIVTRSAEAETDWAKFKYKVFDIPNHKGTYGERYEALANHLSTRSWDYIELAKWEECEDSAHLERFYQDVIDKGGEGVILRDPNVTFRPGRCPGYLKHKKFRDAEAKIIRPVGSAQWECELPNGVRFVAPAGASEFLKRWQPQSGDVISFKHRGFLPTTQKPKLPSIYRMRHDLKWEDVVDNWHESKRVPTALPLRRANVNARTPKGYWTERQNRRSFLDEFAKERGFDSMQADWWYCVTWPQIRMKKGGATLWKWYPDLRQLITDAYPELSFQWPTHTTDDDSSPGLLRYLT